MRSHEGELRRELGTLDLALAQIAYMITLEFFGAATKAGPAHSLLWLTGIALFFIPLAFVVTFLNDRMPLEGGLYEWARLSFNEGVGFLVAWNLWLYIILLVGEYGFVLITYVAFAFGDKAQWMMASKAATMTASVLFVGALVVITALGLKIGKWVINAGGLMTVFALGLLIALAASRHWIPGDSAAKALPLAVPPPRLLSVSIFSKMTFGALCGFEFVAILAGECRNPARTIRRSVLISAPIIGALYIFGTSAIMAFVPPSQINLIGPVPQALSLALQSSRVARIVAPITILLLFSNVFCTGCLTFAGSARLPMVAGWEGIVPEWFTRLHPKYRTPLNSVMFAAIATLIACVIALAGVNQEEAFSLIQIWGFTLYGLVYLAMFAIPLVAGRKLGVHVSLGMKVAAFSGFVVTLIFVVLSVFPVIDVPNPAEYAWKTIAVVSGLNAVGVGLYLRARNAQSTKGA
ncbi:MAG TPA: APC family permease [Candidatus Sulfotelmatobacter sp.]|nr:APC family permease [Candidatus Sulfotelmatobacter sp.]